MSKQNTITVLGIECELQDDTDHDLYEDTWSSDRTKDARAFVFRYADRWAVIVGEHAEHGSVATSIHGRGETLDAAIADAAARADAVVRSAQLLRVRLAMAGVVGGSEDVAA